MQKAEIGIIGGSGLYSMPGLTEIREETVATPFGDPSDSFILGKLEGRSVAFLARHGRGHRLLPSELNFRANIFAMKQLGVEPIGKGHAEAEAFFNDELVRWKKVIDRTGIKLEH